VTDRWADNLSTNIVLEQGADRAYDKREEVRAGSAKLIPSVRWTPASFSLPLLLFSLGTSICQCWRADVGSVNAFSASFQEVQWIVLAYLLAISTRSVKFGMMNENPAATDWTAAQARNGAPSSLAWKRCSRLPMNR
jgi:hypothetical protein